MKIRPMLFKLVLELFLGTTLKKKHVDKIKWCNRWQQGLINWITGFCESVSKRYVPMINRLYSQRRISFWYRGCTYYVFEI